MDLQPSPPGGGRATQTKLRRPEDPVMSHSRRLPARSRKHLARKFPPGDLIDSKPSLDLVAIDGGRVVYACATLPEGIAFLAGRPTAMLCQVLCRGRNFDDQQAGRFP